MTWASAATMDQEATLAVELEGAWIYDGFVKLSQESRMANSILLHEKEMWFYLI